MLGKRLCELRKAKGIRQEELSEILGLQKSTISLYETDKSDPSDPVQIKIAKYFNISLDYMLGLIDEKVPYYDEKIFLKLPHNLTDDERKKMGDYLDFILYCKSDDNL